MPHLIFDADFSVSNVELFRQRDWLLLKDEGNLQRCSLIFWYVKNEQDCPNYIMNLLPRNTNTRNVTRVSWYGMYNPVSSML